MVTFNKKSNYILKHFESKQKKIKRKNVFNKKL